MITPKWSTDGSLTYGQERNNNNIASLQSEFTTQIITAAWHVMGLHSINQFQIRTEPLISFSHYWNPSYQFNGVFNGTSFLVNHDSDNFNFGYAELKFEGNYTTETKNGNILQPYAKAGVDYAFARPNDGQVLTGNLNLATVSPWYGTLTAGVRTLLYNSFLLEGSAAYLSVGQSNLNVWELRLLASYSFS